MTDSEYDPQARLMAAMRRSATEYAHQRATELLAENPDLTATQLVDLLGEEDQRAAAEVAAWDALR